MIRGAQIVLSCTAVDSTRYERIEERGASLYFMLVYPIHGVTYIF